MVKKKAEAPAAATEKLPLQTSTKANVSAGKTIEEVYQKKTQLEHILLRPNTYIGSIKKPTQTLWFYEEEKVVQRTVTYVPGLIFGHLLTTINYDDNVKKTTGGRNGYGAKLESICSTEFIIETANGKRQKKYKQVFSNNMGKKSVPNLKAYKANENWTKVTFKRDLAKFNMIYLENDLAALMKKSVLNMGGCFGVSLNFKTFLNYCELYLPPNHKNVYLDVIPRWKVCVSQREGQFQQVSFVNSIATILAKDVIFKLVEFLTQYSIDEMRDVLTHHVRSNKVICFLGPKQLGCTPDIRGSLIPLKIERTDEQQKQIWIDVDINHPNYYIGERTLHHRRLELA